MRNLEAVVTDEKTTEEKNDRREDKWRLCQGEGASSPALTGWVKADKVSALIYE